ncbi:hypothetical protein GCM10022254_34630 [Actinomadura meridiana]|uniref:Uncharacterized protein n=1 Tax=Actinomadura meridiana TaxID=559626 RepID=A0ABP8C4I8_9ACTN
MIEADETLVMYGGGAHEVARRMLPGLPDSRFVSVAAQPPERSGAARLREAFETALKDAPARVVLVAGIDEQALLLGGDRGVAGVLGSITLDMDGGVALAAEVTEAPTTRAAYEAWDAAGKLGPCGRELCRRTAGELERLAAAGAGASTSPVAAQVVLLDPACERMVGMYGRMAR